MTTSRLLPTPNAMDVMEPRSREALDRAMEKGGCVNLKDFMKYPEAYEKTIPSFSQVDFLASLSPAPGSEEAKRMTVTSGLKCLEWFPRQSPLGSLAKMLVGSSTWASTIVFLTWNIKATKCKRLLFQLAPSTPRTEGIGCGLLPTTLLPTPRAEKHSPQSREDFTPNLAARIQMLPTPTDSMLTEKCSQETYERNARPLSETLGMKTGLKLHSDFVAFLMGYPIDWLDIP